jgi:hypothetical protein
MHNQYPCEGFPNIIRGSQHLVLLFLRFLRFLRRREGQNTYAPLIQSKAQRNWKLFESDSLKIKIRRFARLIYLAILTIKPDFQRL